MTLAAAALTVAGLLALAGAAYQSNAAARDLATYPPPGERVGVGGYRLHLYCVGEGSPTVILDPGLGDDSLVWSLVQPELAKTTRVCALDRGGLGWSDLRPEPRTVTQMAYELHVLLANASVPGPYVLVGHSLAAFSARMHATLYSYEVAGLVLIDPLHEDQDPRDLAGHVPRTGRSRVWLVRSGLPRLLAPLAAVPDFVDRLPADVRPAARALLLRPERYAAASGEWQALPESIVQMEVCGSFGDRPLIVLTPNAALDPAAQAILGGRPGRVELQARLAALSSRGRQVMAGDEESRIHLYHPDLVVDAVVEVVQAVRTGD